MQATARTCYFFCVVSRTSAPPTRPARAARAPLRTAATPEDHLARAVAAATPALRARHARKGLATRAPIERTIHAMLLRQLHMAHYEAGRFREALDVALQALEMRVLVDVVHQDAARACTALGLDDEALGHLRLAARRGPAERRAFHLGTLGAALFLQRRYDDAASCLDRASRWATSGRSLYQAHAMVARLAAGQRVVGAHQLFDRLERDPAGQGYGRWVLGQLAFRLERWPEARAHLEAFVDRTTQGRPALALALAGELEAARAVLGALRAH